MDLAGQHYYIVSYDVMDVKRLRRVHERMMGFGDPIHYSVFGCRLTGRGRVELKAALLEIMDPDKDRIMIIDMGLSEGWMEERIEFLGVAPPGPVRRKYIIV